jgi:hypothetical protein
MRVLFNVGCSIFGRRVVPMGSIIGDESPIKLISLPSGVGYSFPIYFDVVVRGLALPSTRSELEIENQKQTGSAKRTCVCPNP